MKRKRQKNMTTKSPLEKSKTSKRINNGGRNILLNCHSIQHGLDRVKKEIKIENNDKLYYNDKYYPNLNDYRIDISILQNDINNQFGKQFDVIYLVNCPEILYIDEGNWNLELFQNFNAIVKEDGVVITRIAETGINSMLNSYNSIHGTNHNFLGYDERDDISEEVYNKNNLDIKKKVLKEIIPILRKMTREFLKRNNLGFKLLSRNDNKQYIHKNFSDRIYESIYEFFVIKKISSVSQIVSPSKSKTPSSLASSIPRSPRSPRSPRHSSDSRIPISTGGKQKLRKPHK